MKFSIVIPTFNRSKFISQIITDVINQTYTNWELIIIDDGSTDNTKEVISKFIDNPKIQYFFQLNAERSNARNHGIKDATGDFICFVDSDEKLHRDHLSQIKKGIEINNHKVGVYNYDIGFEFKNPKQNYTRKGVFFANPVDPSILLSKIIGTPQLCISKKIMNKYLFDPEITVGEDMELLFRISTEFPIFYIKGEPTIFEIEHELRSVNNRSISSEKQLLTLKTMFSKGHPANAVSRRDKNKLLSEVYFNASIDYLKSKRIKGLRYLLNSIQKNIKSKKTKFKIFLVLGFFTKKRKNYEKHLKY